jgi:hypothetical protein
MGIHAALNAGAAREAGSTDPDGGNFPMTVGFLQGWSDYEPEPGVPLDYVELPAEFRASH